MENLLALARNVNWGFNTKNNELFTNSAFRLYNYAQRETKLLVEITDSGDLQTVGLAFSYNARFIKYEDTDINSVSAENAYYCLAKSMKLGNSYSTPELYNLLKCNHTLLIDRILSALMLYIQKTTPVKMPIGMITQTYGGYKTKGMIEDAERFVPHVRFFVISQFYDIKSNKSKIPTDLPFLVYSDNDILSDISEMLKKGSYDTIMNIGEDFFKLIYKDTEDILLKY